MTHHITTTINKSVHLLNDDKLFSSSNDDCLIREENEVFRDNGDEDEEEEVEVSDDDDDEMEDADDADNTDK